MFSELLVSEWSRFGSLSADQIAKLDRHYQQLQAWNARMNLTRISDLSELVRLHYCESLFLGTLLPEGSLTIVDVGSGAGFPGVPLAVVRPESRITLVESNARKAVFLREACRGMENVTVVTSRAQEISGRFDWVSSRAVALEEILSLRLAPKTACLMSREDLEKLAAPKKTVSIPWGQQRIVAIFDTSESR
jgi:16S rRNA (guanine527-N7)-methyltransferase